MVSMTEVTGTSEPFELSGGALCLDFANTWGDRARPDSDRLRSYDDLLAFAAQAGALGAREAVALRCQARLDPAAATAALAAARRLRDAIYGVVAAVARGRRVANGDVDALNAALAEALPHLRLEAQGEGFRWDWRDGDRSLLQPLRPLARSAAELLTGDELARTRECDGVTCTWLFLDQSRNRSRRWCSMESCGNRAKARRHYHRRKG